MAPAPGRGCRTPMGTRALPIRFPPNRPPATSILPTKGMSRSAAAACSSSIRTCARPAFTSTTSQRATTARREHGAGSLLLGVQGGRAHRLVDVNPFPLGTNSRLNTNFSYLDEFQNVTHANYNGMTVNLRRTFSNMHGWGSSFFTLGYTWSHELDNVSGFRERNSEVPYYDHDEFYVLGRYRRAQRAGAVGGMGPAFRSPLAKRPQALTSGMESLSHRYLAHRVSLGCLCRSRNHAQRSGTLRRGRCGLGACRLVGSSAGIMNPQTYQTINGNSGNYYFNPNNFSNTRLLNLDASRSRTLRSFRATPTVLWGATPSADPARRMWI
jgi:hypothetical protein